jgi:hypothetical protein
MSVLFQVIILILIQNVVAFLSTKFHQQVATIQNNHDNLNNNHGIDQLSRLDRRFKMKISSRLSFHETSNKSCTNPCDKILDREDDIDMDRREAAFAMIGTIWAVTGGTILPTAMLFPGSANAEYGVDANLFIPNPYDALNDRV